MSRTALVIGGSGPTGPHVLDGLLERGYDVTIFHRGSHEPSEISPEVAHIHGDPHFAETIDEALGDREWDVVLAAYGRTKLLSQHLRGRAAQFMSIGGAPRYAGYYAPETVVPAGLPIPVREDGVLVTAVPEVSKGVTFGRRMVEVEEQVFADHPTAAHIVYPLVYGPRNVVPRDWSIVRRVFDGRRRILLPDDGLAVHARGSARNLAHLILCAVDRPASAAGQVFNGGDDVQYSLRQWAQLLAAAAGGDGVELVGVPSEVAPIFASIHLPMPQSLTAHDVFDIGKATALLGYRPVQTPQEAIAELVAWYRENPVTSDAYPMFVDSFDYELEDVVLDDWAAYVAQAQARFPGLAAEVHPMAHPKAVGAADAHGR